MKELLARAEAVIAARQDEARGGVLEAATAEEFEALSRTLPHAERGEHGVLLVPRALEFDEWPKCAQALQAEEEQHHEN
jgi:hypothetical protein